MRPRTRQAGLAAGTAALLAACSGSTGPEAGVARGSSHGRVRVAVTVEGPRTSIEVGARFLGYREIEAGAAELLAGPLAPAQAPGCVPVDVGGGFGGLDDVLAMAEPGQPLVRELDAGEISVVLDGAAVTSTPGRLPALFPYVTGVEYGDELIELAEAPPREGSDVVVSGNGGAQVGGLEVYAQLPATPVVEMATLGDDLRLRWRVAGATTEPVVVAVQRGFGEPSLICQTDDDGELLIGAEALAQVPGWRAGDDVVVIVERVRRERFGAVGLSWGELELAVRYVVSASAR